MRYDFGRNTASKQMLSDLRYLTKNHFGQYGILRMHPLLENLSPTTPLWTLGLHKYEMAQDNLHTIQGIIKTILRLLKKEAGFNDHKVLTLEESFEKVLGHTSKYGLSSADYRLFFMQGESSLLPLVSCKG
jgi:hypothetical protein